MHTENHWKGSEAPPLHPGSPHAWNYVIPSLRVSLPTASSTDPVFRTKLWSTTPSPLSAPSRPGAKLALNSCFSLASHQDVPSPCPLEELHCWACPPLIGRALPCFSQSLGFILELQTNGKRPATDKKMTLLWTACWDHSSTPAVGPLLVLCSMSLPHREPHSHATFLLDIVTQLPSQNYTGPVTCRSRWHFLPQQAFSRRLCSFPTPTCLLLCPATAKVVLTSSAPQCNFSGF